MISNDAKRIAIIGGGISGLAAAYRLTCLRPDWSVTLFESANQLGGALTTEHQDGFLIEHGADSFIVTPHSPWAMRFCEQIGFREQIISTNEQNRRALVLFRGRLHPIPNGFQLLKPANLWAIARSPLLSPLGKLRVAWERYVPAGSGDDESLTEFTVRRLGREAFERLVQPLVAGIYTADPDRLSMKAALPEFLRMEQDSGSLTAAARRQSNARDLSGGAKYGMFWTPKAGMSSMIEAAMAQLKDVSIRLNQPIHTIRRHGEQWRLQSQREASDFDGVIVATPASIAAKLLSSVDETLSSELSAIPHASSTVVCVGYRNEQFRRLPNAFGCVIPRIEKRRILAISFSSLKYPHRAPAGCQLLRVFLGGALQPELAALSDDETRKIVDAELQEIFEITGEPCLNMIVRWPNRMPQYMLGHCDRVERIHDRVHRLSGLALACNGLSGVGIPQCIRNGTEATDRIVSSLSGNKDR